MSVAIIRLLTVRVRGVSLFETLAFACLVALMLAVYLFKAGAGQESARINELNRDILAEQRDVRRLTAAGGGPRASRRAGLPGRSVDGRVGAPRRVDALEQSGLVDEGAGGAPGLG